MKNLDLFSRRFLSVSIGIALVIFSATFMISTVNRVFASEKMEFETPGYFPGTGEDYIPLGIAGDYAYWVIFSTEDGYKFRKKNVRSEEWQEK